MPQKCTKPKSTRKHILVGTWASADEFTSDVEYVITSTGESFAIRAVDANDGEEADIFEIMWDGEVLTFAVHWSSTGRFARCRMVAQSTDHVAFTYTYTDQEILHRK